MSEKTEVVPKKFLAGIDYLKKGKTDKGIKRINSAQKDGYKPAMVFLDIFMHNKNIEEALNIYESLMKGGFPEASLAIGKMYYEGNGRELSPEKSVQWFLESAREGGVQACSYIGEMRENGRGLPIDLKKAFEWYERGAERGDIIAKYNLGRLLRSGDGGYKDLEEAVDNWYDSAKAGYPPGM